MVMIRLGKISVCIALLFATASSSWGFALLGPFPAWQLAQYSGFSLDYGEDGDIGGPQRPNEGYRWNVPVITYRCEVCGVTETALPERLDAYWVSAQARGARLDAHAPRRYCGEGCVGEADRAEGSGRDGDHRAAAVSDRDSASSSPQR